MCSICTSSPAIFTKLGNAQTVKEYKRLEIQCHHPKQLLNKYTYWLQIAVLSVPCCAVELSMSPSSDSQTALLNTDQWSHCTSGTVTVWCWLGKHFSLRDEQQWQNATESLQIQKSLWHRQLWDRQLLCAANMKAFAATGIQDTLEAHREDRSGLCSLVSIII